MKQSKTNKTKATKQKRYENKTINDKKQESNRNTQMIGALLLTAVL